MNLQLSNRDARHSVGPTRTPDRHRIGVVLNVSSECRAQSLAHLPLTVLLAVLVHADAPHHLKRTHAEDRSLPSPPSGPHRFQPQADAQTNLGTSDVVAIWVAASRWSQAYYCTSKPTATNNSGSYLKWNGFAPIISSLCEAAASSCSMNGLSHSCLSFSSFSAFATAYTARTGQTTGPRRNPLQLVSAT